MKSKITGREAKYIFTGTLLGKYDVKYFQCEDTGFIQTEEPFWLQEAYSSAITQLDLGLPYRNELLRDKTIKLLNRYFDPNGIYLDYAGGYGLFTRLMRDKGFNFYHTDKYCQNLFSQYFDLNDIGTASMFEVVTAFEVFEHMANPLAEMEEITKYSNNILFTTELLPDQKFSSVEDWWYFIPETGQHISLYTKKSLEHIAGKLGYNFYSDGINTHLFSRKKINGNPFERERDPFFIRKMRKILNKFDLKKTPVKDSLLNKDWSFVKSKLR